MKTEKVILSFIAVMVGLLVAGVAFFIYQSTKVIPVSKLPKITINSPSPTNTQKPLLVSLSIDQPLDQSVVTSKSITISGKSNPDAIIVVDTASDDQIGTPSSTGDYSIAETLDNGENQITVTAIGSNGQEITKTITVTYSTEDF